MSRELQKMMLHSNNLVFSPSLERKLENILKKAPSNARSSNYPALIEKHKNNPRFIFSTVPRLTESHSSIEALIPFALSSNDCEGFFANKIITIGERIHKLVPTLGSKLLNTETFETTAMHILH